MRKPVRGIIFGVLAILVVVVAFIIGDYLNLNIISALGTFSRHHVAELIPDADPHTADEVVSVEYVEPIDDSGAGAAEIIQQKVPYIVHVDFQPIIMGENQVEKKLLIMTQKVTAPQIAKKDGLFSLPVFKQTKVVLYHGEGDYYVDLSSLSSSDFEIDDEAKSIVIHIPKPQLSVKLLPEETEFFDSSNGMLRFGNMELSLEVSTKLQTEGIKRITDILESDTDTWDTAVRYAKLSVKEIYEPLVIAQVNKAVESAADEYAVPAYYTITVEVKE